jgi:hypothetical protein
MKNYAKISIIILYCVLLSCFFISLSVKAGSSQNVSGWAWSENLGWISFNSVNCDANGDGKSDGTPSGCPSSGTAVPDYGANIASSTGYLSGYAWSENVGWIKFDPDVSNSPNPSLGPAKLDSGTSKINGWARACAGTVNGDCTGASRTDGWEGWIRMSGTGYGVSLSGYSLTGFAWGSDNTGWLSFDSTNCDSDDNGISDTGNYANCPTGQTVKFYGVFTGVFATGSIPVRPVLNYSFGYCGIAPGMGLAGFYWNYLDPDQDPQMYYELQVERTSSPSGLLVDCMVNQVVASGGQGSSAVEIVQNPTSNLCDMPSFIGDINYGKNFRARVKVEDGDGNWSDWSDWAVFSTAAHAYPWIDFSWSPTFPVIGSTTLFTDQTITYGSAIPAAWSWTFQNGNPPASYVQNPQAQFTVAGSNQVSLTTTDSDGFMCSGSKTITIKYCLMDEQQIAFPARENNLLTVLSNFLKKFSFTDKLKILSFLNN